MDQINDIKTLISNLETKINDFKDENVLTLEKVREQYKNGKILISKIPKEFINDYEINMIFLLKNNYFLSEKFNNDKDFFIDYTQRLDKMKEFKYKLFNDKIITDPKIFKEVLRFRPNEYKNILEKYRNDKEYNLELIKEGCNIYQYLKKEFKEDKEFLTSYLEMIMKSDKKNYYFPKLTKEFSNDKDIIKTLLILIDREKIIDIDLNNNFIGEKLMKDSMFLYECIFINHQYIKNIRLEEFFPISDTRMFNHMIRKLKEIK